MKKTPAPTEKSTCPMCYNPEQISEKYFVDWDDSKKEFHVSIGLYCRPCGHRWNKKLMKALPLHIAQESHCSCGANLRLANFSISRGDDEIEFKGLYVCDKCSVKGHSVFGQLLKAVGALWRSTKKVEVGPTGIKFEKEAQSSAK